jgi:Cys-tRNA(Pro)/Cys-tRNA(Cys) deacylase
MKKAYPTWIDKSAEGFEAICVSGGVRGMQIKLNVQDLCRVTGAKLADLADPAGQAELK